MISKMSTPGKELRLRIYNKDCKSVRKRQQYNKEQRINIFTYEETQEATKHIHL